MSDQLKEPEDRFMGRIADLDDSDKPREKALALGRTTCYHLWQWFAWEIGYIDESRSSCFMRQSPITIEPIVNP